ncbi:hypothetical protein SDC9_86101 [bioreactor metagenome]|uniref:Uncharacterized protein n=1 Tax=bioreactor metagenome TaxID=1076179 RepID=A0A644ZGM2_9ZZZZ
MRAELASSRGPFSCPGGACARPRQRRPAHSHAQLDLHRQDQALDDAEDPRLVGHRRAAAALHPSVELPEVVGDKTRAAELRHP